MPDVLGPYRLTRAIARGGMGSVHEAVHESTGEVVAVKKVALRDAAMLEGLRREIHALGRLHHRGIVRILGQGLAAGMPWYAMELATGRPLAPAAPSLTDRASGSEAPTLPFARGSDETGAPAAARTAPAVGGAPPPQALPRTLGLVRQLCAALRYMHGEGIVHRDLKPDNVIVRPDDSIVIIDFGLAASFGALGSRDVAAAATGIAGTLGYISPEQLAGDVVDARADLYALGCILYELLTGRLPFPGPEPSAMIEGHLSEEPVPPSAHAPHVPATLDALVLGLLAKDRRRRPGYADDVARSLVELGADPPALPDDPPPRTYLYRASLSGREDELALLRERMASLRQRAGGTVLVTGPSGVGKTRLVLELLRLAALENVPALVGGGVQDGGAPLLALWPVLQTLGDRCAAAGRDETARVFGRRAKVLAAYEPSLASLPGVEGEPEPAALGESAGRLRLLGDLVETLVAASQPRGALLVLDDLQWADELTLALVAELHRAAARGDGKLLVVATCRREEPRPEIDALSREGGVAVVALERLSADAVGRMCGDMLALEELPPPLGALLARHAGGNPFYVAEYVRTCVDVGLLRRDAAGTWQVGAPEPGAPDLPLPRGVVDLVRHHLTLVDEAERRVLGVVAVLGRAARPDLVRAVASLDDERSLSAVSDLVRRQLLVERTGGFRFDHDTVRDVVETGLAEDEHRALHERSAVALEALPPAERAQWLGELGKHARHAGRIDDARVYLLEAARNAAKRYAGAEAERLYREHLELGTEEEPSTVAARLALATDVLVPAGRLREAVAELEGALAVARKIGDREGEIDGLVRLGNAHRAIGSFEAARAWLEGGLALAREAGDRAREGVALNGLAVIAFDTERYEEAQALDERALERYLESGDRGSAATVLGNLANGAMALGRPSEARQLYARALAMAAETGDRRGEAAVLGNLAGLEFHEGKREAARDLCARALGIAHEIGDRRNEGYYAGKLGTIEGDLGNGEAARRQLEQAVAKARTVGDRRLEGIVLTQLGSLEGRLGRHAEAIARQREALDVARSAADVAMEVDALSRIAAALDDLGEGALAETARCEAREATARAAAAAGPDPPGAR